MATSKAKGSRRKRPARKPSAKRRTARAAAAGPAPAHSEPLHELLAHTPAAIAVMRGPDFVFESANRLYERVVGRRVALGRPLREVVPEFTRQPEVMAVLERVMRTGDTFIGQEFPVLLERQGGGVLEEAFFNITYAPLKDAQGAVTGVLTHAVEVTTQVRARQQAEELAGRLRQSEERYRQIVETAEEGIWVVDARGAVVFANRKLAQMLGHDTPETLRGAVLADFMDTAGYEAGGAQAGAQQHDLRLRRRDGSELWALLSTTPVTDARGQAVGRLGMLTDISARRAAEERQQLLVRVSEWLAGTLDFRAVLERLAQAAVPQLADSATVDLLGDTGRVERLVSTHSNPAAAPRFEQMARRWPLRLDQGTGLGRVLRTGEPLLVPEMTDEAFAALARSAEHLAELRALGVRSLLSVPLEAHGRVLGALTLAQVESGRRFGEEDLRLARELARRASLSIDNALLYQEARAAQARTEKLQAATSALAAATSPAQVADVFVSEALQGLGARRGSVALLEPDGSLRVLAGFGGSEQGGAPALGGPAGEAVRTGASVWVDAAQEADVPGPGACVPLRIEGRALGVVCFSRGPGEALAGEERELLEALAGQCALALARTLAAEARVLAEERLLFLLEASRALAESVAESPRQMLGRVAQLAARSVASYCLIDLVEPDGRLERVALAHRERDGQALLERSRRFAPRSGSGSPLLEPLATGRSLFLPKLDPALRAAVAVGGAEHLALLEELAPHSALVVPIVVRGRSAGLISLAACGPQRAFVPADLSMAEELARRAGAAMDNAQLFHATQKSAWRARFLADAYQAMEEREADLGRALQALVQQVSEAGQDACVLTLLEEPPGTLEVVAMHHPDPEALALMRTTLAPTYREGTMVTRVARTGEALLVSRVDPVALRAVVSQEARAWLERYGLSSLLIVPLRVAGRTIGTLGVSRSRPEPPLGPEDQELFQELADRAALVIDNARLLSEARTAVRLRDEFLAVASHELKTPLTPLTLKLQALRRDAQGGRPGQVPRLRLLKDLDVAESQVRRFSALIHTLLDVSRISQGRLSLVLEEVDLSAVVRGVVQDFTVQAARSGSALEVEAPEQLVGHWDRLRLEQVAQNLISNALKYGAGQPVRVGVERAGDGARLTVRDAGIGIEPEVIPRLFGRFERGVSERHYGGLGLGLYITRHIVQAMGGTVRVESAPGQGALFTVELPLQSPAGPAPGA